MRTLLRRFERAEVEQFLVVSRAILAREGFERAADRVDERAEDEEPFRFDAGRVEIHEAQFLYVVFGPHRHCNERSACNVELLVERFTRAIATRIMLDLEDRYDPVAVAVAFVWLWSLLSQWLQEQL